MNRVLILLTLILGISSLAAPPVSTAMAMSVEIPASGSSSVPNNPLGSEVWLSEEAVRGKVSLAYDLVSDDAVAARGVRYVDTVVPGAFGQASSGAAQVVRTLQTGGNKILKRTADGLNDALGRSAGRRDWGRALEGLKRDLGLPGAHHGQIRSTGDYVDEAGNVLGNLVDYLP